MLSKQKFYSSICIQIIQFVYSLKKVLTAFSCSFFCYISLLIVFYLRCSFVHFININAAISDKQLTKSKKMSVVPSKLHALVYDIETSECPY